MKTIILIIISLFIFSCSQNTEKIENQEIINKKEEKLDLEKNLYIFPK